MRIQRAEATTISLHDHSIGELTQPHAHRSAPHLGSSLRDGTQGHNQQDHRNHRRRGQPRQQTHAVAMIGANQLRSGWPSRAAVRPCRKQACEEQTSTVELHSVPVDSSHLRDRANGISTDIFTVLLAAADARKIQAETILSATASIVRSMSASVCARLGNSVSYPLGAKYTPRSSRPWKKLA